MMWQITPGQQLLLRAYGDESVLYNNFSGDTHLLGGSAIHLLELLSRAAAAPDALFDSLAAAIGCPRDGAFDDGAEALLAQLASIFLVEPVPC